MRRFCYGGWWKSERLPKYFIVIRGDGWTVEWLRLTTWPAPRHFQTEKQLVMTRYWTDELILFSSNLILQNPLESLTKVSNKFQNSSRRAIAFLNF